MCTYLSKLWHFELWALCTLKSRDAPSRSLHTKHLTDCPAASSLPCATCGPAPALAKSRGEAVLRLPKMDLSALNGMLAESRFIWSASRPGWAAGGAVTRVPCRCAPQRWARRACACVRSQCGQPGESLVHVLCIVNAYEHASSCRHSLRPM